jgi:hypothetical protein
MYKEQLLYIYWYTFLFVSYATYFLSVLYIAGFTNNNTKAYLSAIDNYAKIIVSLFLMWKFNVFHKFLNHKIQFTELDRSIVFQSGLFLFLTTSLNTIVVKYLITIKNYLMSFYPNKHKSKSQQRINELISK